MFALTAEVKWKEVSGLLIKSCGGCAALQNIIADPCGRNEDNLHVLAAYLYISPLLFLGELAS